MGTSALGQPPTSTSGQPLVTHPPTLIPIPSPNGTTLDDVKANLLAAAQNIVAWRNADALARYKSAYADYVANMQTGQNVPLDRRNPPVPDFAWLLVGPDANGLVFAAISSTTRVCPTGPAVKPNSDNPPISSLPENSIDIGPRIGMSDYFATGPTDTWPANKKTPPMPPDGHVYVKIPAPVGSFNITYSDGTVGVHGGWYERVA